VTHPTATKSREIKKTRSLLFFMFLLSSPTAYALDITFDNTLAEIAGDNDVSTCKEGDIYRLGTTATYNGQAVDILVEVLAEDNEYDEGGQASPCIGVASGILETRLKDNDAGDD